jgi:hypothetical protein
VNERSPAHPGSDGCWVIGDMSALGPVVIWHVAGCLAVKRTLCRLAPLG